FASQAAMNNIQTVFGFQRPGCDSGTAIPDFQLQGGTFLSTSRPLDYTLYIPDDPAGVDPQSIYGWISLDVSSGPVVGDFIFLTGHPSGLPRKISLESNAESDGFCHLDRMGQACLGPAEGLKYMCDTAGGSSGSFVMSRSTFAAIGLHDCGGCPNTATSSIPLAAALESL